MITTSAPDNRAQHLVARSIRGIVSDPSAGALAAAVKAVLADARQGDADPWLSEYGWDAMTERVAGAFRI